jgi:hypothetical protein
MDGNVARMIHKIVVRKPEGRRPLWRPGRTYDNIKINLKDIMYKNAVWIHLAQDTNQWRAFVNMVMNLRFL